ncbi:MAG: OmpH family outer membrane protein [Rhodobacteraceae bacterium]|nr:OmpH family outer membrane protein [Paracoccaceae bacterium]
MFRILFVAVTAALLSAPAVAQPLDQGQGLGQFQSPVLTLEPNRLLTSTLFGRRMVSEFEAVRDEIQRVTTQFENALIAEEQQLTEMRGTVSPEEFRALADAFDKKAQDFRRQTEERETDLSRRVETAERQLLQAALPILDGIMSNLGAAVVVDRRSVFLSRDAIDITDLVIQRLDETMGDGTAQNSDQELQD